MASGSSVPVDLCECEPAAGFPHGLGCEKEGWFISNVGGKLSHSAINASSIAALLSNAICCRANLDRHGAGANGYRKARHPPDAFTPTTTHPCPDPHRLCTLPYTCPPPSTHRLIPACPSPPPRFTRTHPVRILRGVDGHERCGASEPGYLLPPLPPRGAPPARQPHGPPQTAPSAALQLPAPPGPAPAPAPAARGQRHGQAGGDCVHWLPSLVGPPVQGAAV